MDASFFLFYIFYFLIKTWRLYYPECSSTADIMLILATVASSGQTQAEMRSGPQSTLYFFLTPHPQIFLFSSRTLSDVAQLSLERQKKVLPSFFLTRPVHKLWCVKSGGNQFLYVQFTITEDRRRKETRTFSHLRSQNQTI